MGYEQKEPMALCDGCGEPMYEGKEFWTLTSDGVTITARACTFSLGMCDVHYCCVQPCLEQSVVREVRKLAPVTRTPPDPSLTQLQDVT